MPETPPIPGGNADSNGPVFLSVVVPAHNEERRLPGALETLWAFLRSQPYASEILVVENGSSDRTVAVAREFAAGHPGLRVLQEDRRGKGLAVRRGMLEARGRFRLMCDADLSMPVEEIPKFLPPRLDGADVAIGSREAPGSRVTDRAGRRLIGRAFNLLTRLLVLPGYRDTQCGFKCFTAAAAELVFRRLRTPGLGFDVEALCIARRHGCRIVEVPIVWIADQVSRVRLWGDSVRMAADLLTIRRNRRRGLYD